MATAIVTDECATCAAEIIYAVTLGPTGGVQRQTMCDECRAAFTAARAPVVAARAAVKDQRLADAGGR